MVGQSFFSVVRLMALGLLSLGVIACTAQHTKEISRKALQDVGLKRSVAVARSNHWSLPSSAAVYLAPVYVVGADQEAYPRLRGQLDTLLEALVVERFQGRMLQQDAGTGPAAGVLLRVGLAGVTDRLSSAAEVSERSGMSTGESGRDQLRLVMKVYDVRTGQLLDAMSADAVSGWRWKEHQVQELAEPTLRAMLNHLHGSQSMAAVE